MADFDHLSEPLAASLAEHVGYDKASEVQAALKRIAENLLHALGDLKMSEETLLKLLRAVSAIAVDTYLPFDRRPPSRGEGYPPGYPHGIEEGVAAIRAKQVREIVAWLRQINYGNAPDFEAAAPDWIEASAFADVIEERFGGRG